MRGIRFILPVLGLMALTACETVKGAGRDIGTAGNTITHEANSTQKKM